MAADSTSSHLHATMTHLSEASAPRSSPNTTSALLTDPNRRTLAELAERYPLPPGFGVVELFAAAVEAAGSVVHACGLSAEDAAGRVVTGAAAELAGAPVARSYFELLERAAIFASGGTDATEPNASGQRYAVSSGVAVASTRKEARHRAHAELVERDRVLRSFYGETRPERLICASGSLLPASLDEHYELVAYRFAASDRGVEVPRSCGGAVQVVGVFGFPRRNDAPLLLGFGARSSLAQALAAAARESLQQLAFGWGEPVPAAPPEPSPTPEFHLDHFAFPLHHARLRAWLEGEHHGRGPKLPESHGSARFVDLTPSSLRNRLYVVRCTHQGVLPLTFGAGHPLLGELPESMRVHPIA